MWSSRWGWQWLICMGMLTTGLSRVCCCLLAGPGGVLGAAEGLTYLSLAAGLVVLGFQVRTLHRIVIALVLCMTCLLQGS